MKESMLNQTFVSERFAKLFTSMVMVISSLSLIGWYSSLMILTKISINEVPMAPSTAYIFIFLVVGLWFYIFSKKKRINRNAAIVSALTVICLSCYLIITFIFKHYTDLEHVFIEIPNTQLNVQLGHMSLVTAVMFLISGLAFLFLLSHRKVVKAISIIFMLILFLVSLTLILAYGCGTPFSYFGSFIPPAFLTALSFLLVSSSLIAASYRNTFLVKKIWEISTSATLLRIFLPVTIAIIFVESIFIIRVQPLIDIHPVLGIIIVSIIVVSVVSIIISVISRSIGGNLDTALNKLNTNEGKYRTMIETSNDLIWMLDHQGNFTFLNAHTEIATGYLLKDLKGKSFIPLVVEDELPFLTEVFEKTISGETVSYEMNLKTVYGNTIILAVNTAPLYTDGEVQAIFSFGRDITQRKEAERLLKESEMRFKTLHNASFGGIAIHDKGVIKDCNQGLSDITGYSFEELIGKNGLLCIAENSRNIVKQNILDSYEKAYEVVGLRKNGEKFPLRLEGKMIPYEGKIIRVVEFRDITERIKAENNIRRLSTAVKQSPSVIVITSETGKLEYVNPKFTELTGYSSTEVIGKESNILKSGEQGAAFYKEMWKIVESGNVWRGQFHNKKKNGELFWEAASISAIYDESGNVINYIKIGEDITQQKNTETKLKIALEKALESDKLKSAFLANMSHEIRTPMNGILGFINLLNQPDLSKNEIDQYSTIINKSSDRLLNTINDIIDISKIEAGEMNVSKTETSLKNIVDEVYSFHFPEAKQKGLALVLKASSSSEEISIITDSHKLHGILTNLIKNSIKYTERGYVKIGYLIKENFIEFSVEDTGIGISENRIHAIFNRFEQADIGDTRVYEGSGLGLAISKAYAVMLGGDIFVESVKGQGTKFTCTIPYIQKSKQVIEQFPENNKYDATIISKLKLLVVEDDEVSRGLLKEMLKGVFQNMIFVNSGIDAIELFKNKQKIDLVLMDLKLPGMSGYETTEEIRTINQDVVVIAQTAFVMPNDKEKAMKAGCNDYISKPINKELLLEMLNKYLIKAK